MKIVEQLTKLNERRLEIANESKEILFVGLKQFMVDNPEIEAIRWTQYIPWFNDGEPCLFAVNEIKFSTEKTVENDEGDYEDGFVYDNESNDSDDNYVTETTYQNFETLSEILHDSEDSLQYAFGDHVQVTVTKDGIDVEEYEHD